MPEGRKIFGAFVIGAALFFGWPVIVGTWQEVQAMRTSVAEREQLLAKRTEILANLAAQYQEYTTKLTADDGKKFSALVPVKKDSAELVSAIQEIAGGAGATISELRMGQIQNAEGGQFQSLAITMDLSGTYGSLRTFLTNLEAYVRLLNVDSIQAADDSARPGSLKFSIRATTYFLK